MKLPASLLGRFALSTPRLRVVLGCGLAGLIVLLAAWALSSATRQREIANGRRELTALNALMAEQSARTVQSIDLVVAAVARDIVAEGINSAASFSQSKSDEATFQALRARIAGIPPLDAVTLISSTGRLINFSRFWPVPDIDVSDRDYFEALRDNPRIESYLSGPVQNRGTGTWTIYVARRLSAADGSFMGLVLGAIQLDYFQRLYEATAVGQDTRFSLWRRDGLLLARYPALFGADPGGQQAHKIFAGLPPGAARVITTRDPLESDMRLVAERSLPGVPVIAVVSRPIDAILADWRTDTRAMLIGALACILAIIFACVALLRQFAAYEAASAALGRSEEAVRARHVAEQQLSEAHNMESVGRLTAGVAHDFNNLLMTMSGGLELLAQEPGRSPRQARLQELIRQAIERGAQLTRKLLAFSRQQVLAPAAFDLNKVVADNALLLGSTLGDAIRLELDLAPGLPSVFADAPQIEHVLLNLALNAREAMPGGGTVRISTARLRLAAPTTRDDPPAGEYLQLSVSDSGIGMAPDVLARAFEPFFTTRAGRSASGLGLSQVYGVARQSGGAVRIESAEGVGTTVRILLPRAERETSQPSSQPAVAPQPSQAAAGGRPLPAMPVPQADMRPDRPPSVQGRFAGLRVLVVEDNPAVRDMVGSMLEELGCTVQTAQDGSVGLGRARAWLPDLVLADIAMPQMDGLELARRLRESGKAPPIVFMTGYDEGDRTLDEPYVLQKPFRVQEAVRVLSSALG